jgi:hypothetical protein
VTPPELQPTQRIELAAVVRNALERLAPILDELEVLVEVVPAIGSDVAEVRALVRTGSTWADLERARELAFLIVARVGAARGGPLN